MNDRVGKVFFQEQGFCVSGKGQRYLVKNHFSDCRIFTSHHTGNPHPGLTESLSKDIQISHRLTI
jgi:hypothetical protein